MDKTINTVVSIRLIVGAPNGTAVSGAVDNVGVVYRCPVARGSCEPLLGDGGGADRRLYDTDGEFYSTVCMA